jgi:hypothetical protein
LSHHRNERQSTRRPAAHEILTAAELIAAIKAPTAAAA